MLPAAGLGVHELPRQPDDVGEQPLGEPVLAHHAHGEPVALVGELEVAVTLDREQPVALHPRDRLADRRAALVQPLGDPGPQRHDALLLQLVDGPEVHLGGVDQVAHGAIVTDARTGAVWRALPRGTLDAMATVSVMWFRRDLRLHDNPALLAACAADEVVPLFVLDPLPVGPVGRGPAGLPRGVARVRWTSRSAAPSWSAAATRATCVPRVAREVAALDRAPRRRLRAVRRPPRRARSTRRCSSSRWRPSPWGRRTPWRRAGSRTAAGDPYKVYTAFQRAWADHGWRDPVDAPARPAVGGPPLGQDP